MNILVNLPDGFFTHPDLADIFARLAADGDRPVVTGFVIGAADRRYRAQLNIVRAPTSESEVLLAFVSGG